jgi:hypothetical protein
MRPRSESRAKAARIGNVEVDREALRKISNTVSCSAPRCVKGLVNTIDTLRADADLYTDGKYGCVIDGRH